MKIGLIGYGRMGKIIEQISQDRGHEIVAVIDLKQGEISNTADVYIDFSTAEAMSTNISRLCELKVPVVIGTTGWLDQQDHYQQLFTKSANTGVWAGNFALGVNLFWQIIKNSTQVMDQFSHEYDILTHEYHHKNKIDSPSGTAIQTGEYILQNSSVKNSLVTERLDRQRLNNELHVSSTRGGSIPGTHTVLFDSDFDSIEITHTSRTRQGFALGAVIAAEKINNLPSGLHNFSEIFEKMLK
jgi:4-hydroxy-tetrahydrodipicolinate reductase